VEEFKKLEISPIAWIRMSPDQQKQKIKIFKEAKFGAEKRAKVENVHVERRQDMWGKAEKLLGTP